MCGALRVEILQEPDAVPEEYGDHLERLVLGADMVDTDDRAWRSRLSDVAPDLEILQLRA